MREELRKVPFECRACWHVWEEEYTIKFGDRGEVWLRGNVPVPPPTPAEKCPRCGCYQAVQFPEGYLAHHPELIRATRPAGSDATPLISPVRKRPRWLET
ncbi:hypothetical protein [Nonomuraea ferruginea]|uniref:Uncharacterized protein n=1 Tax=Nonomuraea ferruginea TaxID=46174 RepID=A0ABT4SQ68_9ACTN|nr:hypothetical protein [Nonomuraea ferruginea]MDA0639369.1 hypothetical protein [Nonomuraea ferruginea]